MTVRGGRELDQPANLHGGTPSSTALLSVAGLRVSASVDGEKVELLHGVDLALREGETVGIVGESGSGKTTLARAMLGLLPRNVRVSTGEVGWKGSSVTPGAARRLRGSSIAMVFQDPFRGLNPAMTVGAQVGAVLATHLGLRGRQKRAAAVEMLERVGIPAARQRYGSYPFELSGGLRQRALIAVALAGRPELLIADEPTTALDATIQAQILDLLASMRDEFQLTTVLITHDLGVVAGFCDRVAVMYGGEVVEQAGTTDLFASPRHPYTRALLDAVPRIDRPTSPDPIPGMPLRPTDWTPGACSFAARCPAVTDRCRTEAPGTRDVEGARTVSCHHPLTGGAPAIADAPAFGVAAALPDPRRPRLPAEPPATRLDRVSVDFRGPRTGWLRAREPFRALDEVSLEVDRGEVVGVVGESGSGKTTLGRVVVGDLAASTGSVAVDGIDVGSMGRHRPRHLRRRAQMVFQNPASSLTSHMTVEQILTEPFVVHRELATPAERRDRVVELLESCGLRSSALPRRPREFSGGEQQRIAIARALAVDPQLVVADEPVSALDVSVKAQITRLLLRFREERGLALLVISHDIAHLAGLADTLAVMYSGKIVEQGPTADVLSDPRHPYTRALIAAVPVPDPTRSRPPAALPGELIATSPPGSGCRFQDRCPLVEARCREAEPALERDEAGRAVACFRA